MRTRHQAQDLQSLALHEEAIRLVLTYFFQELRYQKCNATVYAFNTSSIKLHESLGFQLEGRIRRNIYTSGQFYDELIYGITREEFEGLLSASGSSDQ